VETTVLIPIPDVNKARASPRNLLVVVTDVQWPSSAQKSDKTLQLTYAKEYHSMMTSIPRCPSGAQYNCTTWAATYTTNNGYWWTYATEDWHQSESWANDISMTFVNRFLITIKSHRLNKQRRLCHRAERDQIGTKLNKYSSNCT